MNGRVFFVFLAMFLCGCLAEDRLPEAPRGQSGEEESTGFPITLIDAMDREVTFETPPQRVISVAPKNTEVVYAIGLEDHLVGVTTFCNYPPAAEKLDKIGGFTAQTINQETIVALNPDLILCSDRMHEPLIPQWENLGIPVFVLGAESLEQMYHEMRLLGRILGNSDPAEKLIASLQERVDQVRAGVSQIPAAKRPKVFYQVWDEPLMGAGPSSFIGEILDLTGGKNILNDVKEPYPYVAHEVVVKRNPSVVFAPTTHSQEVNLEKIAHQPGWEGIDASRKKQIFLLNGDQVSRRGPRMIDALEKMVAHMYPEQFEHHPEQTAVTKGESE